MSSPRELARRLGLGQLIYRHVHRPLGQLSLGRQYGYRLLWRAKRGEKAMRRAALLLPPPATANRHALDVPVCFLTGKAFLHQTLFCLHSLSRHVGSPSTIEILSDRSLDHQDEAAVRRLWPHARVCFLEELDATVAAALPPRRFPALHRARKELVLMRKLMDSMAGRTGIRMLLDSDMLFWDRPAELLSFMAGGTPCHMRDIAPDGYTLPRAALERHLGTPVASWVNSGLVLLDAGRIDWELLERACAYMLESSGDRRLLEQTLWAVALGPMGGRALDGQAYAVAIDPPGWEALRRKRPGPALMHYAWHARLPYAAEEWHRYLRSLPQ